MAEYIERKTMIENIVQEALYYCYHDMNGESRGLMSAKELLQKAPTADVEPVRRGKWLENEYRHYCSECGHMGLFNGFGFKLESNYCPHCGAKMEEYKSDIT